MAQLPWSELIPAEELHLSSHAIPLQTAPVARATPWVANGSEQDLPLWAQALVLGSSNGKSNAPGIRHHQFVVSDASSLSPQEFTEQIRLGYEEILADIELKSILRIWNFIPEISNYDEDGLNRYMRFNAARFEAFQEHSSGRGYPPASGVGHAGKDLVVHLLEGARAVQPVKNPRQVSPHNYSKRWGPLPPAFARAAIIELSDDDDLFLISGTASVNGECTIHPGEIELQLDETITNLQAIFDEAALDEKHIDSLLIYVTHSDYIPLVQKRIKQSLLAHATDVELRIGPLCREHLLVEIEGFCRLDSRTKMA